MTSTLTTRLLAGASIAAALGACGPSSSSSTSPATTPVQAPTLMAVLQGSSANDGQPDTVSIIDSSGTVVATARFQPRKRPYAGNVGIPLQPVATVVRAGVYFIDGNGTVSKLAPHTMAQVVASFPQQPQQVETWFAVSPDGARLLAGVYTFPAIGPQASGSPFPTLVGPWKFDLESSPAGGQASTLMHLEAVPGDSATWSPVFPVGWVSAGPVAMVPESIGTQNAWWGGPLYLIGPTGARLVQVGGPDCDSAYITLTGFIPCTVRGVPLTVRDTRGDILWTAQSAQGYNATAQYVAPDGQGISDGDVVETRTSGAIQMPPGFRTQGWLSSNAVIGRFVDGTTGEMGNLTYFKLNDLGTRYDLGIKADFVGTLPS